MKTRIIFQPRPVEKMLLWCTQNRKPFMPLDGLNLVIGYLVSEDILRVADGGFYPLSDNFRRQEFHKWAREYEEQILDHVIQLDVYRIKMATGSLESWLKRFLKSAGCLEKRWYRLWGFIPYYRHELTEHGQEAIQEVPDLTENDPADALLGFEGQDEVEDVLNEWLKPEPYPLEEAEFQSIW